MRVQFAAGVFFAFIACNDNVRAKEEPVVTADSVSKEKQTRTEQSYVHKFTDTAMENKITAVLMKLPFVQKSNRYIDSISNHKHGISFMLDNTRSTEISVLAGYNSDERFETYYHFFVDPQSLKVMIYDPLTNKNLPVKEFVKTLK